MPALQQLAAAQLAGRDGAVVALDPSTGAVEAMYSNPTYDPSPLASPNAAVERFAWAAYNAKNAHGFAPLLALGYQRDLPAGLDLQGRHLRRPPTTCGRTWSTKSYP